MKIPEGYKLVPLEPGERMASAPDAPPFDSEPPVIAYGQFDKNGSLRCWSSTNDAAGLKDGGKVTELIDIAWLRFHVSASEHVEAHLQQQIDIMTIDLEAARARVKRMTGALEMVADLRAVLEQQGLYRKVQFALGIVASEEEPNLDELFKPGSGNAAARRLDGIRRGCDQPQAHPARCGCEVRHDGN